MSKEKYKVVLTDEDRKRLETLVQKREDKGYRIKRAQILLELDRHPTDDGTYKGIHQVVGVSQEMIVRLTKRFVEGGVEKALDRKPLALHYVKVTKEIEEHICRIAKSPPPEGRSRWTERGIAKKIVQLRVVESLSQSTVNKVLKKYEISLRTEKEMKKGEGNE